MKAILEFNLPEDKDELTLAKNGQSYYCVLYDISMQIRAHEKYGEPKDLAFDNICNLISEVNFDEVH